MKLLWFSHFIPFPPVGGAHQRSFNLIRQVSKSYEISLVAFNLQREPQEKLQAYKTELRKYCAEVEFWELPLPWKGALWWAGLLLSPFFSAPFSCRSFWSQKMAILWKQKLSQQDWDLLHVDSPDLALFIDESHTLPKVLNHHNCESAMADRRAENESNPLKKVYLHLQARKLAHLESAICHVFQVNTVVSEEDAQLVRANDPKAHTHVVENGTDTEFFVPTPGEEEPCSLIFAGSLNWYPNLSAMRFFGRGIWPLIRQQCPTARFYLAGQTPPDWLAQWAQQDSNVVFVPNPQDMRPWMARAAVSICPIRDGGGTRLKILDAMAMGKAVVATTLGAEGLRVKAGEHILIADTAADFAREVLRLLEDDRLRRRLGAAGRALVEREYSWEAIAVQLKDAYQCALVRQSCHRKLPLPTTSSY